MDSKYVRKTVENLLAELERNPAIGRRPSPSFMSRYGRPLGLGIALGVSGVAGCSGSSETKDALPAGIDAYGIRVSDAGVDTKDALPPPKDVLPPVVDAYGTDIGQTADTRDALPGPIDAYGVRDVPLVQQDASDVRAPDLPTDTRDALPPDSRDALPHPVDVYGIRVDALDASVADTPDAQPQSPEVSREVQPE